jgi:hypothetical protein
VEVPQPQRIIADIKIRIMARVFECVCGMTGFLTPLEILLKEPDGMIFSGLADYNTLSFVHKAC